MRYKHPKDLAVQKAVSMPLRTWEILDQMAEEEGKSRGKVIEGLIQEALQKPTGGEKG